MKSKDLYEVNNELPPISGRTKMEEDQINDDSSLGEAMEAKFKSKRFGENQPAE